MENLSLKVSSSPHVRDKDTTSDIMFDVVIALVPAAAFGLYLHGWYAALLTAVCIGACVGFEALYQHCMHKKVTVGDFSAVVTGLLLAMNLPPEFPIWMAVLGCAFAIIVVKQLFGGLGQNFMNPALAARCFLLLAFSRYMTAFVYDGVSTATPLGILKSGGAVNLKDMFFGYTAGTIGETSVIALLIGAVYLLIKRVISPKIPLIYIGSFAICIALYALAKDYNVIEFTAAHLCGGGLMLGAWFMATDYVTSPITPVGKVIYAVLLGALTFVLRIFGGSAEGVSYAIIISNLFVPLIERVTVPKAFGAGAELSGAERAEKKEKKEEAQKKEEQSKVKEDSAEAGRAKADLGETGNTRNKMNVRGIAAAIASIFVITLVMGAALGAVYDVTKEPIAEAEEKAKQAAYAKVMDGAAQIVTFSDEELNLENVNAVIANNGYKDSTIDEVSIAANDEGNVMGFVVLVTNHSGYGGDIQMAVGISIDLTIRGISFLSISETAGLGMEAKNEEFLNQFIGQRGPFTALPTGVVGDTEIDAISGATITTNAVVNGINAALNFVEVLY